MTQMTQEQILALANEIAEYDEDMTEVQSGGGNFRRRLPEGWAVARFTSLIEKGKHIELFQGKAKDPALAFTLGFELFSEKYLNEDGTPYFIETFDISRTRNEKSRAFKLFKAMNYEGTAKAFAQLLGKVYLVEIKDYLSKNAKPGTEPSSVIGEVRAGIEVVSGQPYQCPPPKELFLFSWAKPTLEGWDSFFIEGTNDKGKSKNWKQEKIAGATDFAGSPLEALLVANGRPIPKGTPQKTGAAPQGAAPAGAAPSTAAPVSAAPAAAPAVAATPAAPVVAPAVNPPFEPTPVGQPQQVAAAPVAAPAVAAPVVAAPVVAAPVAPVVA